MSTATVKKNQPAKKANHVNIGEMETNDVFSEISHYKLLEIMPDGKSKFLHLESKEEVILSNDYVEGLLATADQYHSEVTVGKEDKQDGTLGIRSIWEEIHSAQVFTVCYTKQDTKLSGTKLNELRQTQIDEALKSIGDAQKNKKGVANAAISAIKRIQENPINPIEPGEERILRGYKVQFTSRDGRYNCVDMDIDTSTSAAGDHSKAIRPVNINTIKWLVFKGVKYVVK